MPPPLKDASSSLQTSITLLERLRLRTDRAAWDRFVEIYTPLMYAWARRLGLQSHDAADLVQEVLLLLLQKLPEFRYDREQSFRGWLWTVLVNKERDRQKKRRPASFDGALDAVPDLAAAEPAEVVDAAEYRKYLVARVLAFLQSNFEPTTWRAFWEVTVHQRPAAEVAAELGITVNAVYIAKSRVLRRLREELDDLPF